MAAQSTLVPVFPGNIAGHIVQLCDARTLHLFLQVRRDFTTWIKGRIQKFGFLWGEDFITVENLSSPDLGSSKSRVQRLTDYHLTLDMAKELAMVENNEQGRVVRRYFIECERRALQAPEQTTSHRPTTFHFDKNCIRVLTYHGKPWFVAKDLVPVLGYTDIMEMANHLRHDEHRSVLGYYSLSEFGLYSAIIESDSPDADRFQRWITSKVIPVYQPKDQPPVPVPAVSKSVVVDKIEQHIHCIHKLSYDYVSAIGEDADIAYLANPKEIRYHERQLALLGVNREAIYSFYRKP